MIFIHEYSWKLDYLTRLSSAGRTNYWPTSNSWTVYI